MTLRLTLAAVLALLAAPAAAGSLEPFAGSWKGAGTARAKADAAAETARCRLTSTLSADARRLDQSGQCAIPGHKVAIGGTIRHDPATDRLTGSWTDVATGRSGSISGRFDGTAMRLTVAVANPGQGEESSYTMVLTPGAGGWHLVTRAPGADAPLADIQFSR